MKTDLPLDKWWKRYFVISHNLGIFKLLKWSAIGYFVYRYKLMKWDFVAVAVVVLLCFGFVLGYIEHLVPFITSGTVGTFSALVSSKFLKTFVMDYRSDLCSLNMTDSLKVVLNGLFTNTAITDFLEFFLWNVKAVCILEQIGHFNIFVLFFIKERVII
ncbi:hypothetical protein RFI_00673 [Reticulomyxa filosa]|uniref:Uncharacterized protein n=1 Tax=Reticulomyxa filosa TaxID=46433 RepID=X6PD49_RETFI|nr:hypothetical protein RFI_00673 [Reticulomyxa filosa]|eukprot:ETO36390.1 hypothetical protein RFI_00673 [Reticulomyxa filosa]